MLQKQQMPIPISNGLQTKMDEKLVQAGSSLVLENAVFEKLGALKKRYGLTNIPLDIEGGGTITTISKVYTYHDIPIIQDGNGQYYHFSDKSNTWLILSKGLPCTAKFTSVAVDQWGNVCYDMAVSADYIFVLHQTGLTRIDKTTNKKTNYSISDTIKMEIMGSNLFILGGSGTIYKYDFSGNLISSAVLLVGGNLILDTMLSSDGLHFYCAFRSNTAEITVKAFDSSLATTYSDVYTAADTVVHASIIPTSDGYYCAYTNSVHDFWVYKQGATPVISGMTTIQPTQVHSIKEIMLSLAPAGGVYVHLNDSLTGLTLPVAETFPNAVPIYYIVAFDSSLTSIVGRDGYRIQFAGKGQSFSGQYAVYDYLPLVYFESNSYTYVLNRIYPETANFLGETYWTHPKYSAVLSRNPLIPGAPSNLIPKMTQNYWAHSYLADTLGVGLPNQVLGAGIYQYQFTSPSQRNDFGNLLVANGILVEYDGKRVLENNFIMAPEIYNIKDDTAEVVGFGSGVPTSSRSYQAIFQSYDANGQVIRSQTSNIFEHTNTTGVIAPAVRTNTVKVLPLSLGGHKDYSDGKILLYRTAGTGNFQFVMSAQINSSLLPVSFPDSYSDAEISTNENIYTTGGVLDNEAAPCGTLMTIGGNRVFIAGGELKSTVYYSKKKLPNESINFNSNLLIEVTSSQFKGTDDITALGYMDDKLIIFKSAAIFYVAGDGPLETGEQNTFTDPEVISSDTGCIEPRSVINFPDGILFKSAKGIYTLTRNLQVSYIGAAVEYYNSYTCVASMMIADKNQIRFVMSSGVTLVYDYLTQAWDSFPGWDGVDADIRSGVQLTLLANTLKMESRSLFTDNSAYYPLKMVTPWIKPGGIQNFGRMWRLLILGKYKSVHTLNLKVYYNYDETLAETHTIVPNPADTLYQFKFHLAKQKCEAVKFEVYDSGQAGTGESMELSSLSLEVGVKQGSFKGPTSRQA